MPGLLVVGLTLAANPSHAATAIARRLARVGQPASAVELDGDDPAALVETARAAARDAIAVASVEGGLLAALTPRYSVRDLARELDFPIVLAAPSTADALNLIRLSAESARGAGLTVLAVVLTRWPTPPDRVLLDERRMIDELVSGVEVDVLADTDEALDEAARKWDWVVAEPGDEDEPAMAPAPSAGPVAEVVLDPYVEWIPVAAGDPRTTPRPRIMEVLLSIIAAEGPMRATRAYSIYNRASGGKKLTTTARAPLSSAVYWLAQERKLLLTPSDEIPWQDDDLVRMPDAPAVRVRELGPRVLEEVPLDEIAELMRRLEAARGISSEADLKRAVLQCYGLVRLTTRADEYLGLAFGLLTTPGE